MEYQGKEFSMKISARFIIAVSGAVSGLITSTVSALHFFL